MSAGLTKFQAGVNAPPIHSCIANALTQTTVGQWTQSNEELAFRVAISQLHTALDQYLPSKNQPGDKMLGTMDAIDHTKAQKSWSVIGLLWAATSKLRQWELYMPEALRQRLQNLDRPPPQDFPFTGQPPSQESIATVVDHMNATQPHVLHSQPERLVSGDPVGEGKVAVGELYLTKLELEVQLYRIHLAELKTYAIDKVKRELAMVLAGNLGDWTEEGARARAVHARKRKAAGTEAEAEAENGGKGRGRGEQATMRRQRGPAPEEERPGW